MHWDALTAAVERTDGDVDLLLTCQWPADVTAGLPAGAAAPEGGAAAGSEPLSAIAVAVRPRQAPVQAPVTRCGRPLRNRHSTCAFGVSD